MTPIWARRVVVGGSAGRVGLRRGPKRVGLGRVLSKGVGGCLSKGGERPYCWP